MLDPRKHKVLLSKILLALYKDHHIAPYLLFKGGTCAMLFYGLPRMSVDLDFDLIKSSSDYQKIIVAITNILQQFGRIDDYEDKHYTIYYELNYGFGDKNIKIEISKRGQSGQAISKNFLGEQILIMEETSLMTNKLIALLHRKAITNRDIFDIWFFLQKGVRRDDALLASKIDTSTDDYIHRVKNFIQNYDFSKALYGLGELVDETQKNFIKTKMKDQLLGFLEMMM